MNNFWMRLSIVYRSYNKESAGKLKAISKEEIFWTNSN